MKKTNKIICLGLTAALIIGSLGGCGKADGDGKTDSKSSEKDKRTFTIWLPPLSINEDYTDKEFWNEQLADVMEKNNATLNFEVVPWDNYEEKYMTAVTSGEGPDIGSMYPEMLYDYIEMGAIIPLDEYFTEEEKEEYIYMDKGVVQGKQYTLPYLCGNPRILYCNMDILNAAGVNETPKTWDEFIDTAEKISETQPDKSPYLAEWANPNSGGMNNCFYPFLWQAGGAVFDDDGNIVLDTTEALRAVKFVYDMKQSGILPDKATSMNDQNVKNAFLDGDVGMIIQTCTMAPEADAAGINWDFTASLEDKTKGTFIGADGLVIMNDSKNKDLAVEVIKTMTSAPVMEEFHKNLLKQPPITKSEKSYDDERFAEMYNTELEYFHIQPVVEGSFKVYDSLYKNLQLMLQDQLTPEQALQDTITYAETIQK